MVDLPQQFNNLTAKLWRQSRLASISTRQDWMRTLPRDACMKALRKIKPQACSLASVRWKWVCIYSDDPLRDKNNMRGWQVHCQDNIMATLYAQSPVDIVFPSLARDSMVDKLTGVG